jgi:hypothetical protein
MLRRKASIAGFFTAEILPAISEMFFIERFTLQLD